MTVEDARELLEAKVEVIRIKQELEKERDEVARLRKIISDEKERRWRASINSWQMGD